MNPGELCRPDKSPAEVVITRRCVRPAGEPFGSMTGVSSEDKFSRDGRPDSEPDARIGARRGLKSVPTDP